MKFLMICIVITCLTAGFTTRGSIPADSYTGAWHAGNNKGKLVMMMDDYFVYSEYDLAGKKFIQTWGGPYTVTGNKMNIKIEFDFKEKEKVGKTAETDIYIDAKNGLVIRGALNLDMHRVDDGIGALAGNWRITGRMQGETISEIPRRARKTLKMLSGTRFQWMAINTETGDFSGTGGGTYTFVNGKYTENIEFFSRDSSRVGASLSFDGKVENGKWHHSGLSSRGDPIYEIWSRDKE